MAEEKIWESELAEKARLNFKTIPFHFHTVDRSILRVANKAIEIIQKLGIDSLRAEITWFEAARAYTAASGRNIVKLADLHAVAPMALRLRRSKFIDQYFAEQEGEEEELQSLVKPFKRKRRTPKKKK